MNSLAPVYKSRPLIRLPRPDRLFKGNLSNPGLSQQDLDWIKDILAGYGLLLSGTIQRSGRIGRSSNWVIETTDGKKFLKRYNEEIEREQVIHEHSILNRLAQLGFPAPRLTPSNEHNNPFEREGRQYTLFDYLDGYFQYHIHVFFPTQTRVFVEAAGKALAALHTILAGFTPLGRNPNGFLSPDGLRWREPDWYFEKLDACRHDAGRLPSDQTHPISNLLLQRSDEIEHRLAYLDLMLKQADPPRVLIHGDYGPYNLMFKENFPVVVLDFELSRLDWRLTDLCNSLATFGRSRAGFHFRKMKMFMAAYQSITPLEPGELEYLPLVWEFLSLRRAVVYWRSFLDKQAAGLPAVHQLDATLERINIVDWIHAHPEMTKQLI